MKMMIWGESSGQPKVSFCGLSDKKYSFCLSAEKSCFCKKSLSLQKLPQNGLSVDHYIGGRGRER